MTKAIVRFEGTGQRQRHGSFPPLGQLWQVPVFFIGFSAIMGMGVIRPLWSGGLGQDPHPYLTQAQAVLEDPAADITEAKALAEDALERAADGSAEAARAHFLLGAALLREAEQSPSDSAKEHWLQARFHLEKAELIGVEEPDRLTYMLGKTYFYLDLPAKHAVEYLERSVPDGAVNKFEGYGLLARARVRLDPPQLDKALEATLQQLGLPNSNETDLAPARLLCGELYLQLDNLDEARKVLLRIGTDAPAEVRFQAQFFLARIHQEEGMWEQAARSWEQVRRDPRAQTANLARVNYDLGLCYRQLERIPAAVKAWQAVMGFAGEERQAAALNLAELWLFNEELPKALKAYRDALENINKSGDYSNSLISAEEAQQRFESGCRWLLQAGHHSAALQLAQMYGKLAVPPVAEELEALAAEAWARAEQERAAESKDKTEARRHQDHARRLFRQAANAYDSVAEHSKDSGAKADWLWLSANNYLAGQDFIQAIIILERFVQLPVTPDRLGHAWYLAGQTQHRLKHGFAARAAYRKCIQYTGPYAFRARYELALEELKKNNIEEAQGMLNQNLELMHLTSDAEAHEKTLYTLADLLYEKGDHFMATARLQKALELYPDNLQAVRTRLRLALSCRQLAERASQRFADGFSTPEERTHYHKQRRDFLMQAAAHFQMLDDALGTQSNLPAEDQAVARQAAFGVGECWFDLGQFDKAVKTYEVLAVRYHHRFEGLIALRNVWRCYGAKLQSDKVRETLDRIKTAVQAMPGKAFDETSEIRTRHWWENWVLEKIRLADRHSARSPR